MRRYVAEVTSAGIEIRVQHSDDPNDTTALHNPARWTEGGFEWGYDGAGPRKLACAILMDLIARRFGNAFMREVVARTSPIEEHHQSVVFHEEKILCWLRKKLSVDWQIRGLA